MDPGDSEGTRELDFNDPLNSAVEVLEGAVSTNVGEKIRRFDGIISGTRRGEIVCGGD